MNRLARPAALVGMALAAVGMVLSPAAIAQNLNGDTSVPTSGVVEQTKTFEKTTQSTTTSGSTAKASCPMRCPTKKKRTTRKLSYRPIKRHHRLAAKTVAKPVIVKKTSTFTKTTTSTKTINLPATVQAAPEPAPAPAPVCAPVCSPVSVERTLQLPTIVQQCAELPVTMVRRIITSPNIIEERIRPACVQSPVVAPACAAPCATPCAREFTAPVVIQDNFKRAGCLQAPVMIENPAPAVVAPVQQCAPALIQSQTCSPVMVEKRRRHLFRLGIPFLHLGIL